MVSCATLFLRWIIICSFSDFLENAPYFYKVVQLLSGVWLCDSMDYSTPGFLILHHLPELAQTHVHWVSDAIQPSHPLSLPFSSCTQSFPASGSFPVSRHFLPAGQSIGVSASVLSVNIQGWFPFGLNSLQSKELSRVFSSTTVR